jgi:formate dehydrogenase major subunit
LATSIVETLQRWPVIRQLGSGRRQGCDHPDPAISRRTIELTPRTRAAERVVPSICPYCAVGCGQLVYVEGERITDIEGDPDSPISRGRLCPKGAATYQLVSGAHRLQQVLYRRPHGSEWETLSLDRAMELVADRIRDTREATWEASGEDGTRLNRTLAIAHLGGATLDNEENYLLKKLYTMLGILQVENQARI